MSGKMMCRICFGKGSTGPRAKCILCPECRSLGAKCKFCYLCNGLGYVAEKEKMMNICYICKGTGFI